MKKVLILIPCMLFSLFSYAEVERVGSLELGGVEETEESSDTKETKSKKSKNKKQKSNSQSFNCGEKRYCKEMKSCSEAIFHLKECGLKKLDRDGDGKPCENVCG